MPGREERKWTPRWVYRDMRLGLVPYCTLDGGPANKVRQPLDGEILMPQADHLEALGEAEKQLAECYRLSGAEPSGVDSMDAEYAVREVRRLREESDSEEERLHVEFANASVKLEVAEETLQGLRAAVCKEIVHCDHESEEEARFRDNHPDLQPALHAESRGAAKAFVSMRVRLEQLVEPK